MVKAELVADDVMMEAEMCRSKTKAVKDFVELQAESEQSKLASE